MLDRPCVLIASSDPAESAALADWLRADGFEPVPKSTPQAVAEEIRRRKVALLIADAVIFNSALLRAHLRTGPLTPTIVIDDADTPPPRDAVGSQVMHLSRPVDRALFGCFVSMAILDSRPMRRSMRKPVNRFDAVVNGVPSHIVDVSAEGLRLEVAQQGRAVLPPYFTVQVPLAGITVAVRRMWTRPSSSRVSAMWYGGELSQNHAGVAAKWQRFVDTLPVATHIATVNV